MATVLENLQTAYANYAAKLAEISGEENAKLKYTVGDRSVDWTEYQMFLIKSMKDLTQAMTTAGGPFIVRGYTRA